MNERTRKNISASVHRRLLNIARETGRPFNELLQFFAIERFMYRLSRGPHAHQFVLKGALMFNVWDRPGSRPTMDIDLLGNITNDLPVIIHVMREACTLEVEDDGMWFDAESMTAGRLMTESDHEGVRVRIRGALGTARISLQIDIGFGDVIVPDPCEVTYPALLDFAPPQMNGYTMESAIAEKYQAMVKRGALNSRLKDFYDIWKLGRTFDFDGQVLAEAITRTFQNRHTPIPADDTAFEAGFMTARDNAPQWKGFIQKSRLSSAPADFATVITALKVFLEPPINALAAGQPFRNIWTAPGPWHPTSGR